jgi:hypothetical protein
VAQFAPDEDVDRCRPGGVSRERLDPGPARADRGPEDAALRIVRHRVRPGRSVQAQTSSSRHKISVETHAAVTW